MRETQTKFSYDRTKVRFAHPRELTTFNAQLLFPRRMHIAKQ